MIYQTEIGVTISDAEVEDGIRKSVRDHRIRLWAEHLRSDRSQWHRILDRLAGGTLAPGDRKPKLAVDSV